MHTLTMLLLSTLAPAQAPEPAPAPTPAPTVRSIALDTVTQLPRLQLEGCATAHPAQAAQFRASVAAFREAAAAALEQARDEVDLEAPMPPALLGAQAMMAALYATETAPLPLERCERFARELDALRGTELAAIMRDTAQRVAAEGAALQQGLDRVLR